MLSVFFFFLFLFINTFDFATFALITLMCFCTYLSFRNFEHFKCSCRIFVNGLSIVFVLSRYQSVCGTVTLYQSRFTTYMWLGWSSPPLSLMNSTSAEGSSTHRRTPPGASASWLPNPYLEYVAWLKPSYNLSDQTIVFSPLELLFFHSLMEKKECLQHRPLIIGCG